MKAWSMKAFLVRSVLLLVSLFLLVQLWIFAALVWWKYQPVERTMFMHRYEWNSANPPIRHEWVDSAALGTPIKRAFIAGEDGRFMQHRGFDWDGIRAAIDKNQDKGKVVAGGSTISQQLAKNLFLWNERSYIRKAEEFYITWMLEHLWSKDRILTVYLNSIEFGKGIYGAEAAAQHYYGKHAAQLSNPQAARLAALAPSPVRYQANPNNRRYQNRVKTISRYMRYANIPASSGS